ncbi:MAG: polyribonucleotide nucleotidyltransferase [Patescibacteria group bacterium]|nr:polyribonucleotide nucleotidyltransferase [Patescibacteria group bacterium]
MEEKIFTTEIGGRKLIVKTGALANQANGSVIVQYGETTVLATAVMGEERGELDYFPLTVDYEERFYAAGKIKGSRFIKRETRPPDEAILAGRLIDRSLRPLFNQDLRREVQIITTVLSVDQENDPDLVALYAASLALAISDIPWSGPVAGVRVGQINQELVLNPTYQARAKSNLDLVVCSLDQKIIMIEASALEVSEEVVLKATQFSLKHSRRLIKFFQEIQEKVGKPKNYSWLKELTAEEKKEQEKIEKIVRDFSQKEIPKYLFQKKLASKEERIAAVEKIRRELDEILIKKNIGKEKREKAIEQVNKSIYTAISQSILDKEKRIDGRGLDEIRPLFAKVGVLPRVHGSALFQRGETQVLATVTLGAPGMEQYLDTMEESGRKRFMHHYNFPPFSAGEVAPLRTTGRRETGHSMLVEKGLLAVMPDQETFPYTIRVVSEVLSSNGSTSMASACASCLALMDAGVPIKRPVAGIAVGLSSEEENGNFKRFKTFIDLQDLEDGPGGMDFKVIGTREGITAIQMDTKTKGLSFEITKEALEKAKIGRNKILDFMNSILTSPRQELSPFAPKIIAFRIEPEKIRNIIGPKGKVINEIVAQTGVTIDIENDGLVIVTSPSQEALIKARDWINDLTKEIKVGEIFRAKITRIVDFGAFVELFSGESGLIHISEIAPFRVKNINDILEVGEIIPVKLIKIDEMGRLSFSLKRIADKSFYRKKGFL